MSKKPRNYQNEYLAYQGSEEQKKNRAKRNAARAKLMKEGRVSKHDGNDVDHKNGVHAGNGNGNLRVQTKSENRSYPRNTHGGDQEIVGGKSPKKRKKKD